MIKLSKYAKNNGLSYRTAYRYFYKGIINGIQLPTGTILVEDFKEEKLKQIKRVDTNVVLYARVSSSENKNNLDSQMERLRGFACAKGYKIVKEIKEVGSGINDKRKQLEKALFKNEEWDKIIVEHKDRIARFGLNYIDILLKQRDKSVEVINVTDGAKEDLMQDFVSIVTSFCAKIYGQRRTKRKTEKIIQELIKEE